MIERLGLAVMLTVGVAGCGGDDDDDDGTEAEAESESESESEAESESEGELQWYLTCGDPVCRGYTPPDGVPRCTDEKAGEPCDDDGATCDPMSECNALLTCAASDPTLQPGGCPISRRRAKRDIVYLDARAAERHHDALRRVRLAEYRYRTESRAAPPRLGFIIDDLPEGSPAVRPDGERVDLYGYLSMAVAGLQTQARRIETLEREVAALRAQSRTAQSLWMNHKL